MPGFFSHTCRVQGLDLPYQHSPSWHCTCQCGEGCCECSLGLHYKAGSIHGGEHVHFLLVLVHDHQGVVLSCQYHLVPLQPLLLQHLRQPCVRTYNPCQQHVMRQQVLCKAATDVLVVCGNHSSIVKQVTRGRSRQSQTSSSSMMQGR